MEAEDLQSAIGYTFRNGALLAEALTAPSCRMDSPNVRDNQRLEFLGDAALGLLAAERLFGEFPREQEGRLLGFLTPSQCSSVSDEGICGSLAVSLWMPSPHRFGRGPQRGWS